MKLLIFSLDSYSIFHTDTKFIFGGAEVETGYHARGLANLGVDVSVITKDQGVPMHLIDGVKLYPHPQIKGVGYWENRKSFAGKIAYRIFGDRNPFKKIEDLLLHINPDVIYVMGMSPEAFQLAKFCEKTGKHFVFRMAHDMDIGGENPSDAVLKKWVKLSLNEIRETLLLAKVILIQTPYQAKLLRENYKCEGEMMFPPISLATNSEFNGQKKYDALWIGRSNTFKRPEEYVKLAKLLPEFKFCMVFNKLDDNNWNEVVSSLPSNVELVESVPANEMEKLFCASKVFISTSLQEGFPNTFLQAGKNSLPILSMGSDPNGMLTKYEGGILVGDKSKSLAEALEMLLKNKSEYEKYAVGSKKFVSTFHDARAISNQFLKILNNLSS